MRWFAATADAYRRTVSARTVSAASSSPRGQLCTTEAATHVLRKAPQCGATDSAVVAMHSKHHAVYVAGVNGALSKHPEFSKLDIVAVLKQTKDMPADIKTAARNHGGWPP